MLCLFVFVFFSLLRDSCVYVWFYGEIFGIMQECLCLVLWGDFWDYARMFMFVVCLRDFWDYARMFMFVLWRGFCDYARK